MTDLVDLDRHYLITLCKTKTIQTVLYSVQFDPKVRLFHLQSSALSNSYMNGKSALHQGVFTSYDVQLNIKPMGFLHSERCPERERV